MQMAELEVGALQKDMEELEAVRRALCEFFCEDPGAFKLEDCFKIFHGFCVKFRQAVQENERRRLQEEQTMLRRKLREDQAAAKKRQREFTCLANIGFMLVGHQNYKNLRERFF